jgi:hypothetical protein
MAADIGELERIAADPLIGDGAEPLRALAERLRSTMEEQFDGMAAQSAVFPWWEARCRDVQQAIRQS